MDNEDFLIVVFYMLLIVLMVVLVSGCSLTTYGKLKCDGPCELTIERSGGFKQELPNPKLELTRQLLTL